MLKMAAFMNISGRMRLIAGYAAIAAGLAALLFIAAAGVRAQSPSAGSVVVIATSQDLADLAAAVNSGASADAQASLSADIDLTGVQWTPIGNAAHPFTGTFNGAGHSVTGLNDISPAAAANGIAVGLFGVVEGSGALIEHLTVEGSLDIAVSADCSAALIAGVVENGSLFDCTAIGAVSLSGLNLALSVGGVAGNLAEGWAYSCTNLAAVSAGGDSSKCSAGGVIGSGGAGGMIVSATNAGRVSLSSAAFYNLSGGVCGALYGYCYSSLNSGSVAAQNAADHDYAGGIAGLAADGAIYNSENNGSVSASEGGGLNCAGGVVGYESASVMNSSNSGEVSAIGGSGTMCGGLCGYSDGTLSGVVNSGAVTAFSGYTLNYAGGISGYEAGTIKNAANSGAADSYGGSKALFGSVAGYAESGVSYTNTGYLAGSGAQKATGSSPQPASGVTALSPNNYRDCTVQLAFPYNMSMKLGAAARLFPTMLPGLQTGWAGSYKITGVEVVKGSQYISADINAKDLTNVTLTASDETGAAQLLLSVQFYPTDLSKLSFASTPLGAMIYLTVYVADISFSTQTLPGGNVGQPYSGQIEVSTGAASFSVADGSLPAGLSLSAVGAISGTPTAAGTYSFAVTAAAAAGSVTKNYTIDVQPTAVTIETVYLPQAQTNKAYSAKIEAQSAYPVTMWLSGAIPSGMTFDGGSGTLSGTPTEAGSYSVTVLAENKYASAMRTFTFTVIDPGLTITTTAIPAALPGEAYFAELAAESDWPCSFALSGDLPEGLSLSSSGVISGTPQAGTQGSYPFYVTASNQYESVSKRFILTVDKAAVSILTRSLPAGLEGAHYSALLAASGAPGIDYFASGLPGGLSVVQSGDASYITGTPSESGSFSVSVAASNAYATASRDFTLTVVDSAIAVYPASLPQAVQGVAYSAQFSVNASVAVTLGVSAGSLPPGLSYDAAARRITGAPTAAGEYSFTMKAEGGGKSVLQKYTISVIDASVTLSPDALPSGETESAYYAKIAVSSDVSTDLWMNGSLPPGLAFDSKSGVISGTPAAGGTYAFTVLGVNDYKRASKSYSITIQDTSLSIAPSSLAPAETGKPYSAAFTAQSASSVTWSCTGLPAGLVFNKASAAISGTPSAAGTYTVTVTAANAYRTLPQTMTLVVMASVAIETGEVPVGYLGSAYSETISVASPAAYTQWISGELPAGLVYDSASGTLSGTPLKTGSYKFTVKAENEYLSASRSFTLAIVDPRLTISPVALPSGTAGSAYSAAITTESASAVKMWISGSLPPGLSFNMNKGTISGTPTKPGSYAITIKAENSYTTVYQKYTIAIASNVAQTAGGALPDAVLGEEYSQALLSAGAGSAQLTQSGSLPPGLSIDQKSGLLAGTPTKAGTYSFVVTAKGAYSDTSADYTLTVTDPTLTIASADMPAGTVGSPYGASVKISSKVGFTSSVTGGALPSGLAYSSGMITGTPTEAGKFTFTLTADNGKSTASRTFSINVMQVVTKSGVTALPDAEVGAAYSEKIADGALSASALWYSGSIPSGLSFSASYGTLAGTPQQSGAFAFSVREESGDTVTIASYTLKVVKPDIIISPDALPTARVGEAYSAVFSAAGTSGLSIGIAGALPAGLSYNSETFEIYGTPQQSGSFDVTASAAAGALSADKTYTLTIWPERVISPDVLPDGEVGKTYSASLEILAKAPYTIWLSGELPAGLSIDTSTGAISGTPLYAGVYSFTAAIEGAGYTYTREIVITVKASDGGDTPQPEPDNGDCGGSGGCSAGASAIALLFLPAAAAFLKKRPTRGRR